MAPKPKHHTNTDGGLLETIPEHETDHGPFRKEILYDGYYYDVTDFVKRHPGGSIIEYYTKPGEDATCAIQQFHQRSPDKIRKIMNSLKKRPARDEDYKMSPEKLRKHRALTEDFTKLYLELEAEGLFKPSPGHMVYRVAEIFVLLGISYYMMTRFDNYFIKFLGIALWGITHGRTGWVQHECGHHSFTGRPNIDRMLHAVFFGVGLALSSRWWARGHNRHHAMPQRIKHDVDLDTMPFLCYNKDVVDDPRRAKNFFIRNQAWMFLSIDTLLGSFYWTFFLHPWHCIKHGYYMQFFWMTTHYMYHYHLGIWVYLLSTWIGSVYLFGNFALSHSHLESTKQPTHWVEYALIHTADVEPSWWCDWWMGYLNYQIEHHLFPTMPQFRQPLITHRVRALAKKHGLPYICYSYKKAMIETFKNLDHVAHELQQG